MIEQTLKLVDKLKVAPEAIVLLDGDSLEVNIIRDGQRMTMLNLRHYGIDGDGKGWPVDPLPILITIERGSDEATAAPQLGGFQTSG